ncbi:hypothetical protein B0H14DRAFT_2560066 [Mycena olivaceomarginata]|nr:hypothetical protein B0H14DRAFT_2560066 [Mycena olivaceomarginata]
MESRFAHHFNTNYIPSDEEIECIRMELVAHTQELARIDENIRELFAQRAQIQAHTDPYQALISHPCRLPADILREILVACLPTDRNAVMSAQEAPLCVGFAAHGGPSRSPRQCSLRGLADFSVHYSLSRSWLFESLASSTLFKPLTGCSARWRHLEFVCMSNEPEWRDRLAEIGSPALESLKITGMLSQLCDLPVFARPSLRAVTLCSNDRERLYEFSGGSSHTSSSNASQSQGQPEDFIFPTYVVLLGRCTQLVSFQVSLAEADYEIVSGPILLPSLEIFIMTEGLLASQFLSYLVEDISMLQLRKLHAFAGGSSLSALGTGSPLIEDLGDKHLPSLTTECFRETLRSLPSFTRLSASDNGDL